MVEGPVTNASIAFLIKFKITCCSWMRISHYLWKVFLKFS